MQVPTGPGLSRQWSSHLIISNPHPNMKRTVRIFSTKADEALATELLERKPVECSPESYMDMDRFLLKLIVFRVVILSLGFNLAQPLGILPQRLGPFPFLILFNVLTIVLTLGLLGLRWTRWSFRPQLYIQVAADLCLVTALVANTRVIDSAFISLYLLIIIYCSLTLGRNGGIAAAALSTIFYTAVIVANSLDVAVPGYTSLGWQHPAFRISAHALGFFAVAFLGTSLSQRLRAVQKELQEKILSLQQLQRLHEHIVRSIRSGLITTDLAGTITLFNATAGELLDTDSEGMPGKPVQSIIGNNLWAQMKDTDFFNDPRAMRHEDWITFSSENRRYLGFSVSPLMDLGRNLIGYIISFQDLTEIKRLEEEVRLKDRMAAIGRMAAGIAHEIRNPLTAMRGSVEILRARSCNTSRQDERLFEILICESDRLNDFIENFLHFARPGNYPKVPLDLVSLLRNSMTLLENTPNIRNKHSVMLNLEAPELFVSGNMNQLQQVFWNLCQNAIRAMPDGGTLTVVARAAQDGGGEIQFCDTGIGMTREEMDRLFQPFQSSFAGGVGLGLSIVFNVIEEHHGRISFDSKKGKGTTVTLSFPPAVPVEAKVCV
jgi:two-component system, NtrC family, sensor histidine kinase PilS